MCFKKFFLLLLASVSLFCLVSCDYFPLFSEGDGNSSHVVAEGTPEESFLKHSGGIRLFKGKIVDVLRETNGAFNLGRVILNGIGEYRGRKASVTFQNENLCAEVDGKVIATAPDLICLVDVETFTPVPTDALRYGKRVMAVGLPCFPLWRTKEGLELAGPRYFGIDTDYIPVEERAKEGC